MPDYYLTVHYRKSPLPDNIGPEDPEFWEGQNRVKITTDVAFGESGAGINQEIYDTVKTIGQDNGYTAVSLARRTLTGVPWIEEADGEAFYKSEDSNAV